MPGPTGELAVGESTNLPAAAEVTVLDARLREVARGRVGLRVRLAPGIYKVTAELSGDRQEALVAVDPDEQTDAPAFDLRFDSATPVLGARSHREYHEGSAHEHSLTPHLTVGPQPSARLFIFGRTDGSPRKATFEDSGLPYFVLRNRVGERVAGFPESGASYLPEGWLSLTLDLPPGGYTIEQEVPGRGLRGQAVFVEEEWETQVFAPWTDTVDFDRANVYLLPRGHGFDPSSRAYARADAFRAGLVAGTLAADWTERRRLIAEEVSTNPILGLMQGYALLNQTPVDYRELRVLAGTLTALLPRSPDAALLALLADLEGGIPGCCDDRPRFRIPPLFATGMERLLRLGAEVDGLCPADDRMAGIAVRLTTGLWTRWDEATPIDTAFQRLGARLQAMVDAFPHISHRQLARQVGLPRSIVARALGESDAAPPFRTGEEPPPSGEPSSTLEPPLLDSDQGAMPEDLATAPNESPAAEEPTVAAPAMSSEATARQDNLTGSRPVVDSQADDIEANLRLLGDQPDASLEAIGLLEKGMTPDAVAKATGLPSELVLFLSRIYGSADSRAAEPATTESPSFTVEHRAPAAEQHHVHRQVDTTVAQPAAEAQTQEVAKQQSLGRTQSAGA